MTPFRAMRWIGSKALTIDCAVHKSEILIQKHLVLLHSTHSDDDAVVVEVVEEGADEVAEDEVGAEDAMEVDGDSTTVLVQSHKPLRRNIEF